MSDIFPEVKRIIKSVISQRMSRSVSTKFAIVGYTDHGESGGLDPMNPVTIYPPSGKLNNFDQEDSVQFLNRLIASGGGPELGEAMIDGIYNAYRLQWRPEASKIYFIIGDDCPQGRDFHINTKYPEGCPCGHNWRSLLKGIKSQGAIVKLVKLSEILNKTGALFKEEYGENMEMISLDKMTDLAEAVIPSIVRIIEHNLEFAKS
ncbi:unnamed protein product [Blepharisma stoltei]|uniref:VWFA domain-containing protein n=1 Tax=Blepharisma stoltei TaxID=1481888 RepID=A0AAU9KDB2_9CILI|nr:unnamed protein product [Blepharisma stoltei]